MDMSSTREWWRPTELSNANTRRAPSTQIALGRTVGLEETRTKPLSVSGQVDQPSALYAVNQFRVAVW